MKTIKLSLITILLVVAFSCKKEEVKNIETSNQQSEIKYSLKLISQIEKEINSLDYTNLKVDNNPINSNNPYDFVGVNVSDAFDTIAINWNYINDTSIYCEYTYNVDGTFCFNSYTKFKNVMNEFYVSRGYNFQEVIDTTVLIENYAAQFNFTSNKLKDILSEMENNNFISKDEKNILNSYFNHFNSNSRNNLIKNSKIYENNIVTSNLSAQEKQNLLSIISAAKHGSQFQFDNGDFIIGRPDLETICAGNMLAHIVGGAILGNGLGAGVGVLTGMWANYTAGCFG